MNRLHKATSGVGLLLLLALYLKYVSYLTADKMKEAVLTTYPYIQVEVVDSEYIGKNPVIYGQKKTAAEGFGFYKVIFQVKNLSSKTYNAGISNIIEINLNFDEVNEVIPPLIGEKEDYSCTLSPCIPGKASTDLVYYLEVNDNAEICHANYDPPLENGEKVILDIPLMP